MKHIQELGKLLSKIEQESITGGMLVSSPYPSNCRMGGDPRCCRQDQCGTGPSGGGIFSGGRCNCF